MARTLGSRRPVTGLASLAVFALSFLLMGASMCVAETFEPSESATKFKFSDKLTIYAQKVEPAFDATGLIGLKATGEVLIVTTMEELKDGARIKCGSATYEAGTGDIVLRGRPKVKQGAQLLTATSDETYVRINPDNGKLDIKGPHTIKLSLSGLSGFGKKD